MRVWVTAALLNLTGCGNDKVDVDFNNLAPLNAEQEAAGTKQRALIAKRFNEKARETNKRLQKAYERGSRACNNIEKAGHPAGQGCPRPLPAFIELWDETGSLKD